MGTKALSFRTDDRIGVVTLNHSNKMNVINMDILAKMEEIQMLINNDDTVKVVVIHAEGSHFSVGMDLESIKEFDYQFM